MAAWTADWGAKLTIVTRDGMTGVRIAPANYLGAQEITIPLEILKAMVNSQ